MRCGEGCPQAMMRIGWGKDFPLSSHSRHCASGVLHCPTSDRLRPPPRIVPLGLPPSLRHLCPRPVPHPAHRQGPRPCPGDLAQPPGDTRRRTGRVLRLPHGPLPGDPIVDASARWLVGRVLAGGKIDPDEEGAFTSIGDGDCLLVVRGPPSPDRLEEAIPLMVRVCATTTIRTPRR